MSRDQLNEAFGAPAEARDIDPSHVLAIAQRIENLAKEDKDLKDSFNELKAMLDERLPTVKEIDALREMLSDKAGREWLRGRFNRWGLGSLGVMAVLYTTRTWWSQVFAQLSAWLK